jgi:hypothetical protein
MREGIAAWMAHRSTRAATSEAPEARIADPESRRAPLAIDEVQAGVVRVLANMALEARKQRIA